MEKLERVLDRIHDLLLTSLRWTLVSFFLIAFLSNFLEVITRVFLKKNFFISSPTISYLFVICALSGAVYAIHSNSNITVDLFQKLSKKKVVKLITQGLSFIVSLFLFGVFGIYLIQFWDTSWYERIKIFIYAYIFLVSCFSYFYVVFKILRGRDLW